jgi:hypothetical protein
MLCLNDANVKWGLRLLLYTAAETLFDGAYHLDGRTRRSPKVTEACDVLFGLSQKLSKGLIEDGGALERRLAEVARIFDQLETINVSVITLMVRRDYATAQQRKRTASSRRREGKSPRGLLRLVTDDERS